MSDIDGWLSELAGDRQPEKMAVEADPRKESVTQAASSTWLRMAENALKQGEHAAAALAEQNAAAAAERAGIMFDLKEAHLADRLERLRKFGTTGIDQVIEWTREEIVIDALFPSILAASGANPIDFEADNQTIDIVPISEEVQAHINWPEPSIHALVYDSPMSLGEGQHSGSLYKLHFNRREVAQSGEATIYNEILILASQVQLDPVEG